MYVVCECKLLTGTRVFRLCELFKGLYEGEDHFAGRWTVETIHSGLNWEVILEPDSEDDLLVVVTAYASGDRS